MKGKLIYIAAFIAAFVFTTIAIMYLNNICNNIFVFDFSDPKPQVHQPTILKEITAPENLVEISKQQTKVEPVNDTSSVNIKTEDPAVENKQLSSLADSTKKIAAVSDKKATENKVEEKKPVVKEKVTPTKEYLEWTKKTAGLYEAMDANRAAKIIQNYSDNVARDIIYAMKKKKAAEILSILSPEIAQRITRVQQ
ncbi:MAG: hypothetical protein K8H86_04790 [Ignavibacteriaceae bacterium]|nr:hypothetical protein [Ignavibacteriaceae bacterium]